MIYVYQQCTELGLLTLQIQLSSPLQQLLMCYDASFYYCTPAKKLNIVHVTVFHVLFFSGHGRGAIPFPRNAHEIANMWQHAHAI